jgi:hypothetical protein
MYDYGVVFTALDALCRSRDRASFISGCVTNKNAPNALSTWPGAETFTRGRFGRSEMNSSTLAAMCCLISSDVIAPYYPFGCALQALREARSQ